MIIVHRRVVRYSIGRHFTPMSRDAWDIVHGYAAPKIRILPDKVPSLPDEPDRSEAGWMAASILAILALPALAILWVLCRGAG